MFGGFKIAAQSTTLIAPLAGVKLTSTNCGLAVIAASAHGDLTVVPTLTTGRLTVEPGVYDVRLELSLEGDQVSGTSGDAIGNITSQIYVAGAAVAGTKAVLNSVAADQLKQLNSSCLVEVTADQKAAGTNYIEAYVFGGDASGNDITIREGRFLAIKAPGQ